MPYYEGTEAKNTGAAIAGKVTQTECASPATPSAWEELADGDGNRTPDDHDDAGHSHSMPTRGEAVANLYAIINGTIEP